MPNVSTCPLVSIKPGSRFQISFYHHFLLFRIGNRYKLASQQEFCHDRLSFLKKVPFSRARPPDHTSNVVHIGWTVQ